MATMLYTTSIYTYYALLFWWSFLIREDKKDEFHSGNIFFDYGYKAYEMIIDELKKIKKLDEKNNYKK